MTAKQNQVLQDAIKQAGGQSALARKLGVSRQAVQSWTVAPARQAPKIERLTGISRHDLRPDVYPDRAWKTGPELTRYWETRRAFIEAIEQLEPEILGLNREARDRYISDIELPWLQEPRSQAVPPRR